MDKDNRKPDSKRTTKIPAHVGEQMRIWRENAGLSLEKVGQRIGCGKNHLSQAENGKGNLSLPLFLAYCDAIQTPASRILDSEMMRKDRDFVRLAKELRDKTGLDELVWLAALDPELLKVALERAHEAVAYRSGGPSAPSGGEKVRRLRKRPGK